jgi:hypothetical protein
LTACGSPGDPKEAIRVAHVRVEIVKPEALDQGRQHDPEARADPASLEGDPLHALVLQALRDTAAGATHAMAVPTIAEAVVHLAGLDPLSRASWFVLGLAEAYGVAARDRLPRGPVRQDLADALLAGQLLGLAEGGKHDAVAALTREEPEAAERALRSRGRTILPAAVLSSLFDTEPVAAASLLGVLEVPFPDWEAVLDRAHRAALDAERAGDDGAFRHVLATVDNVVSRWSREGALDLAMLNPNIARSRLARASHARRAGDFDTALGFLDAVPGPFPDSAEELTASRERALIEAQVTDIADIELPDGGPERTSLRNRLRRAETSTRATLRLDSQDATCRLLAGLLAMLDDDIPSAVDHLGAGLGNLSTLPPSPRLRAMLEFHLASARLQLLEPGTDDLAFRGVKAAIEAGYRPGAADLMLTWDALAAQGSPHAGAALALAAEIAPCDPGVVGLVAHEAAAGRAEAIGAAVALGTARHRSAHEGFMLLTAALDGAERRFDGDRVELALDAIDTLVASACDERMDVAWASRLATDDQLRTAAGPPYADSRRVDILRRAGRIDEAREVARRLLCRSADQSIEGFDAADLLATVGDLGAGPDELRQLERLAIVDPEGEDHDFTLTQPCAVVFVGGSETERRYRRSVDDAIANRYGGMLGVEWFIPRWSTRWARDPSRLEARCRGADAVVVMNQLPLTLGRVVRQSAAGAGVPCIACVGHGRASIERAIDRAAHAVWRRSQLP